MNSCLESACEKRVRLHQELKTLANSVAASCLLVFVGHVAMWRCVVDMWRYGINGDLCTAAIVVSSVTAVKHWQRDTPMSEGRAFVAQAETTQLCWNPFWKGATSANCSAKIPWGCSPTLGDWRFVAIVALDLQCFETQFFDWNSGTSEVNGKNEN